MKRIGYILCLTGVIFCSCSVRSDFDNFTSSNITTVTTISTVSGNSDTVEDSESVAFDLKNNKIKEVIDFIKENRIFRGCFYDFDKNGMPELVEIEEGEYFCSYSLYDLDGKITKYTGVLSADTVTGTTNMLTLYYDNNIEEYFYFGKNYTIYNGTDIDDKFYLCIYKIDNMQIKANCIGEYTGVWNGEKYWYKDISFMDTKIEDGYYSENEINILLGVDEYLSQFEKIEMVNLNSIWEYEFDNSFENAVINELNKYPDYINAINS